MHRLKKCLQVFRKNYFEYMTGGVGVVLGPVGPVLGSGMTGGVVYALDDGGLAEKVHADAQVVPLGDADVAALKGLLEAHLAETGSHRAQEALKDWPTAAARFRRGGGSGSGIACLRRTTKNRSWMRLRSSANGTSPSMPSGSSRDGTARATRARTNGRRTGSQHPGIWWGSCSRRACA